MVVEMAVTEDDGVHRCQIDPQAVGIGRHGVRRQAGVEQNRSRLVTSADGHHGGESVLGYQADAGRTAFEMGRLGNPCGEGSTLDTLDTTEQSVVDVVDQSGDDHVIDRVERDRIDRVPFDRMRGRSPDFVSIGKLVAHLLLRSGRRAEGGRGHVLRLTRISANRISRTGLDSTTEVPHWSWRYWTGPLGRDAAMAFTTELSVGELELSDTGLSDTGLSDTGLSDAELTELALAADPDQPLDPDAVPLPLDQTGVRSALPSWYMPPTMMRTSNGWRTWVVLAIIGSLLLVDALGLCITYGQLVAA
jgi:hypothetical protein